MARTQPGSPRPPEDKPPGGTPQGRFDALLAAAADAIIVTGSDGRIQTFSPAAQRIFGYPSEEVVGRNVSLLMPEPYRSEHDGYLSRYSESGVPRIIGVGREVQGLRKDGTVFPLGLSVGHARFHGEDAFVGILRDLTVNKKAEAALQESERALSTLAETFPGMVYRCDNDSAWTMRFVSGGCLALTGHPPEALVDGLVRYSDLIHPEERKRVREAVDKALAAREPFEITYRILPREGAARWVFERGVGVFSDTADRVRFIEGFIEDVTEQKESDQRLQEQNELIRAAFDHAPIAIVTYDLEGAILSANRAASRILGYSPEEFRSMAIRDLARAEDGEEIEEMFRQARDGQVSTFVQDRLCVKKDGSFVHGRMHASVVNAPDGQPSMLVAQFEDRTERRRAREEADRLRESLAHVGRLGMLGEMATGIAHEINQPLTAISTYAQACRFLLEKGEPDPDRLLEVLGKISRSARRAGDVIDHLRTLVRKRNSHRELVRVNELVEDVASLMEVDARLSSLEVQLRLSEGLPPIVADRVQIQQVILNLMRNGLDAMAGVEAARKILSVTTQALGAAEIEVAVRDRGAGVPEGTGDELFHPFVTTKESGMGMGLSICQSIVRSHGGRLWFTHNPEGGVTFHFTIPTAVEGPG